MLEKLRGIFSRHVDVVPTPEPEPAPPGLIIAGIDVFAVEGIPTGAVRFWPPNHPLNPTARCLLVCDLDTYVSLAASSDSQRLIAIMAERGLGILRLRLKAQERRERRKAKRAAGQHGR